MKLHHIALIVSSENCLDFYKSLGFAETSRKVREHDEVVLLSGNGIQLEVFIDPRHPKKTDPEPFGLRHFALEIDGKLEDEMERLKGTDFTPIVNDWKGTRFVFTKDPDGSIIELREVADEKAD